VNATIIDPINTDTYQSRLEICNLLARAFADPMCAPDPMAAIRFRLAALMTDEFNFTLSQSSIVSAEVTTLRQLKGNLLTAQFSKPPQWNELGSFEYALLSWWWRRSRGDCWTNCITNGDAGCVAGHPTVALYATDDCLRLGSAAIPRQIRDLQSRWRARYSFGIRQPAQNFGRDATQVSRVRRIFDGPRSAVIADAEALQN
jgi:hypothetical protein